MNERSHANFSNRMEFLLALMTRDYEKIRTIGRSIPKEDTCNQSIEKVLSLIKKRRTQPRGGENVLPETDYSSEECETDSENELGKSKGAGLGRQGEVVFEAAFRIGKFHDPLTPTNSLTHYLNEHLSSVMNLDSRNSLDFEGSMHRVIPIKIDHRSSMNSPVPRSMSSTLY